MFENETISVEVRSSAEDRRAVSVAPQKKNALSSRLPLIAATVLFALTVTFGRDFLYNQFAVPFAMAATLASIAGLMFFLLVINAFGAMRVRREASPRALFLRRYTVTAAPDGLHVAGDHITSHFQWPAVLSASDTETHLLIHTDGAQAIMVPKRSFASKEEASRFTIIVRSRLGGA